MKSLLSICFLFLFINLFAQEDAYHSNLKIMLQTQYGLTGGIWIFNPNETTNANNITAGGGTKTVVGISGQTFTKAVQFAVSTVPTDVWNAGINLTTNQPISNGDRLLLIFWARTTKAPK
jgi:hypothetical protein